MRLIQVCGLFRKGVLRVFQTFWLGHMKLIQSSTEVVLTSVAATYLYCKYNVYGNLLFFITVSNPLIFEVVNLVL